MCSEEETMSTTDDWLYSDDLDVGVSEVCLCIVCLVGDLLPLAVFWMKV